MRAHRGGVFEKRKNFTDKGGKAGIPSSCVGEKRSEKKNGGVN